MPGSILTRGPAQACGWSHCLPRGSPSPGKCANPGPSPPWEVSVKCLEGLRAGDITTSNFHVGAHRAKAILKNSTAFSLPFSFLSFSILAKAWNVETAELLQEGVEAELTG